MKKKEIELKEFTYESNQSVGESKTHWSGHGKTYTTQGKLFLGRKEKKVLKQKNAEDSQIETKRTKIKIEEISPVKSEGEIKMLKITYKIMGSKKGVHYFMNNGNGIPMSNINEPHTPMVSELKPSLTNNELYFNGSSTHTFRFAPKNSEDFAIDCSNLKPDDDIEYELAKENTEIVCTFKDPKLKNIKIKEYDNRKIDVSYQVERPTNDPDVFTMLKIYVTGHMGETIDRYDFKKQWQGVKEGNKGTFSITELSQKLKDDDDLYLDGGEYTAKFFLVEKNKEDTCRPLDDEPDENSKDQNSFTIEISNILESSAPVDEYEENGKPENPTKKRIELRMANFPHTMYYKIWRKDDKEEDAIVKQKQLEKKAGEKTAIFETEPLGGGETYNLQFVKDNKAHFIKIDTIHGSEDTMLQNTIQFVIPKPRLQVKNNNFVRYFGPDNTDEKARLELEYQIVHPNPKGKILFTIWKKENVGNSAEYTHKIDSIGSLTQRLKYKTETLHANDFKNHSGNEMKDFSGGAEYNCRIRYELEKNRPDVFENDDVIVNYCYFSTKEPEMELFDHIKNKKCKSLYANRNNELQCFTFSVLIQHSADGERLNVELHEVDKNGKLGKKLGDGKMEDPYCDLDTSGDLLKQITFELDERLQGGNFYGVSFRFGENRRMSIKNLGKDVEKDHHKCSLAVDTNENYLEIKVDPPRISSFLCKPLDSESIRVGMFCHVQMNRPNIDKFVYPRIFNKNNPKEQIQCWDNVSRRALQDTREYRQHLHVGIYCKPKGGLDPMQYKVELYEDNDFKRMFEIELDGVSLADLATLVYKFTNNPPQMILQPDKKLLLYCAVGESAYFRAEAKGPDLEFNWYKCTTAKKANLFKKSSKGNIEGCSAMSKIYTHRDETWFSFRYKKTTPDSGGFYIFEAKNAKYDKNGNLCKQKNRLVSRIVELECWVPGNYVLYFMIGLSILGGLIILSVFVYYAPKMTCWPSCCKKRKTKKKKAFEFVMKKKEKNEDVIHLYDMEKIPDNIGNRKIVFHHTIKKKENRRVVDHELSSSQDSEINYPMF